MNEPFWLKAILVILALVFLGVFLMLPLGIVFFNAFRAGSVAYFETVRDPETGAALKLTLMCVLVAIPLNLLFGIAAAWAITKFDFVGKSILVTLIDLPFTVSPVIAGVIFILLFGSQGQLGAWLLAHEVKIVFAPPGVILATLFVTFPYVARELIPLMQAQGNQEEEAAVVLGASGRQVFFRVTLPNIRWGLLYGLILSTARALGEFGAVSVVSGHIRGKTITLPLEVEILYNEYNFAAAFSVASLLTIVALGTLLLKKVAEWKVKRAARMHSEYVLQEFNYGHSS